MQKLKLTIVAQLHEGNNRGVIEYMEASRKGYGKTLRNAFYTVRRGGFNKSKYNTHLQHEYGISKRTASSIISDAQGRFNALKELKEYERKQLERKIKHLESIVIPKLVEKRNQNSTKLREGVFVSLIQQRNLRRRVVSKKAKLNRLKQKLSVLRYQLETGKLKLCFGTKRLLRQDHEKYFEIKNCKKLRKLTVICPFGLDLGVILRGIEGCDAITEIVISANVFCGASVSTANRKRFGFAEEIGYKNLKRLELKGLGLEELDRQFNVSVPNGLEVVCNKKKLASRIIKEKE